ncbi:MAG: phosphoribosylglycinamide formyltransferase [Hyphomicrobiales bacterium]|nr:phosphoribosylglycinamide formyltransferase [Hyphomicrobiales bacterium]
MKTRVGVLISGRGSNMAALIEAARAADYPAEIVAVLSNRPDAEGLQRAAEAGVEAVALDHTAYPSRAAFDAALDAALRARGVELVACAGYMRVFTKRFVEAWAGRLINIHPSLLPAFKGLHPQRQALEAGVSVAGCTVHYVTAEVDSGPIIAQSQVPVLPGDTEETLAARILAAEHALYPAALAQVCKSIA